MEFNGRGQLIADWQAMTTAIGAGTASQVAAFRYVGSGRRARMTLGNDAIVQDLGLDEETSGSASFGVAGLDAFGRVQDLHWRQGPASNPLPPPGGTLTHLQYTYDLVGNRLTAVRTPQPGGGTTAAHQDQTEYLRRLPAAGLQPLRE